MGGYSLKTSTDPFSRPDAPAFLPLELSKPSRTSTPARLPGGGEDIFRVRRNRDSQADATRIELERLKKIVAEQKAARRHAQKTAATTERRLKFLESDSVRLRGDLQRMREHLADAKREHNVAIRKAAERESCLRNELIAARGQASIALESVSRYRKKWLSISLCIAGVALVAVAFSSFATGSSRAAGISSAAPGPRAAAPIAGALTPAAAVTPHDLTATIDRLNQALGRFRGASPEQVLKQIHNENAGHGVSVCSFEWSTGQVSLLFGSGDNGNPEAAISQCADAVEKAAR